MQKVIDQITDQLVTLVTTDKEFYNPKELLRSGIPSFVVERVRLLLEDKVYEEIATIESIWFNSEVRLVSDSRNDYIKSAIGSSHIPKAHLYEIINSVIRDIIYVFVEPRKNMAEYIFRENDELTFSELDERCSQLTIYKHFGTAIPLYMKKKGLDSLSKDRCKDLIHKLDAKLVASYTAQDWAQKLEQLFILFGGKLDPILLATFFQDKGLYAMAGKFEKRDKDITKTDFISIISSEDMEVFSPEINPVQVPEKEEGIISEEEKIDDKDDDKGKSLIEGFFENYETSKEDAQTLAGQFTEDSLSDVEMSELISDIASDGVIETDHYEDFDSLNKLFLLNNEVEKETHVSETAEEIATKLKKQRNEKTEDVAEFRENLFSILDQAKNSFENIDKKETPDEVLLEEEHSEIFEEETLEELESEEDIFMDQAEISSEEKELDKEQEQEEEEEEEVKPVWAQFISEDQMEVLLGGKRNTTKEETPQESTSPEDEIEVFDLYSENPFMEDLEEDVFEEQEEVKLKHILDDRKLEFIEVIFSGSENKYEKALNKFDEFKNWKEASEYIQKEVFSKNDVDMFTGATVDFTDRVHQYFNGKNNS